MSRSLIIALAVLLWLAIAVAAVWYQAGKGADKGCFADTPRMGACE
jgi:hypothetical protein